MVLHEYLSERCTRESRGEQESVLHRLSHFFFCCRLLEECFCYLFSLHSTVDCASSTVWFVCLRAAKLIQSLGGALWLAFRLKNDSAEHLLTHTRQSR